jgi:hypothetical protein
VRNLSSLSGLKACDPLSRSSSATPAVATGWRRASRFPRGSRTPSRLRRSGSTRGSTAPLGHRAGCWRRLQAVGHVSIIPSPTTASAKDAELRSARTLPAFKASRGLLIVASRGDGPGRGNRSFGSGLSVTGLRGNCPRLVATLAEWFHAGASMKNSTTPARKSSANSPCSPVSRSSGRALRFTASLVLSRRRCAGSALLS